MEVSTVADFSSKVLGSAEKLAVTVFFAGWHPPAKQMANMVGPLSKDFAKTCEFFLVDADKSADLMKSNKVQSIPTVLITKSGAVLAKIEGANPPALVQQLKQFSSQLEAGMLKVDSNVAAAGGPAAATAASAPEESQQQRLERLTKAASVMVFMKGSKQQPFCKFSRALMGILNEYKVDFDTFDVLMDESVRAGMKTFSNWPTFPQLYVNGEFVGGVDIVTEMHQDGSLKELMDSAGKETEAATAAVTPSLHDRLKSLVKRAPVMLFMKGDPVMPRCGFSKTIVGILQECGITFESFDILEDEDVRQGLKEFSNWPTYPQLYGNGELIGGLDIVKEIFQEGGAAALKAELGVK
uniref:Thioredoxin domain-containing protein n=1 Tax=Chromera velia CCMP2878 TaxID=1169474 RepID=A0A0G4HW89_9ALVE|mmetsp:Transcript_47481/g.93609  ORF Transcript_47481/g.93609 Transcript_47481/m.93609 type:complete len:354 (-) Transcript_47481:447-1508(-)|eukprot:Cvel_1427.t1-p1 / transcript=Cvel_1427.t1 / gene=Cvel_1427 / organism=Chromera_velia_CCMP2878 / gene_product=Glutaredoxin-3, putative / transcript_product=Glutaredoxin-3, putative / location=Cvel_scaffold50:6004-8443(-) / protein_length=353 / sequence_SO=supercontig / SO=protein_coding / is_pseudo=false